jgi:predicted nucleic acid-binding protein
VALFDTSILLDYLLGDKRADAVFRQHQYRAVSVISWVEVMCVSPEDKHEATRAFLRSFERLSINESIADEALLLTRQRPGLAIHRALTWATAIVNRMPYVTVEATHIGRDEPGVVMPYRWARASKAAKELRQVESSANRHSGRT